MTWDFGAVAAFLPDLIAGALTTLTLTVLVLIVGAATGLVLAVLKTSGRRWIVVPGGTWSTMYSFARGSSARLVGASSNRMPTEPPGVPA